MKRRLLAGAATFIAGHRRALPIRLVARLCAKYVDFYENVNYDQHLNGELFVLKSLASARFSCIFDIGANVGDWTLMARRCFPDAAIHCFELAEPTYRKLEQRLGRLPNVTVNGFGLADKDGDVGFQYFGGDPGLTTMISYPHLMAHETMTGHVATGDGYIRLHGLSHIDFAKIDVEGVEHLVLKGLEQAIQQGKIDIIQFEYGRGNIVTKFLLRDFYALLTENGYLLGKIYPTYVDFREYSYLHEDFRGPNYLAVRKERPDLVSLLSRR